MKSQSSLSTRRAARGVDLHGVLESMRDELRCLLGSAFRLELNRMPAAAPVRARVGQREIVDLLRHLALDVHDAMPTGGAVSILTGSLRVAGAWPGAPPVPCAALVVRDVADDPPAFGAAAGGRIRKGRSLSLGASFDAIERMGGHLCVSCRGRETVVTICFPRAD